MNKRTLIASTATVLGAFALRAMAQNKEPIRVPVTYSAKRIPGIGSLNAAGLSSLP